MKNRIKITHAIMLTAVMLTAEHSHAQQWVKQNSGTTKTLRSVQFIDSSLGFACGDSGTVLKTINGGNTWSKVSINTPYQVSDISFVGYTGRGWAAVGTDSWPMDTNGQVWHTTNGGSSWTRQTPNSKDGRLCVSFISTTTGWFGGPGIPLNIDYTTNGGNTYTKQSDGNIFTWISKIKPINTTTVYAAGSTTWPPRGGRFLKTTDGGTKWKELGTFTEQFLHGMDFANPTHGHIVGVDSTNKPSLKGFISATTDGGASWKEQTSGTFGTLWSVSFVSPSVGWTCGDSGAIVRTLDSGNIWLNDLSYTKKQLRGIYAVKSAGWAVGDSGTTVWAVGDSGTILKRTTVPVGIIEKPPVKWISAYPNPSHDYTSIEVTAAHNLSRQSLIIYDVLGRDVTNKVSVQLIQTGEVARFDVALQLDKGVYTFVVTDKEAIVTNGRLIVN